ncbi:MAG TPA: hypothetical protein VEZ72_04590 [Paenibacillus sp.]|nr:hypothetical protein [Paenibacillus sp.]
MGAEEEVDFETAHEAWLQSHIERRTGERRARLLQKRYAETLFLRKVWWPIFGSFEGLHPEYEVLDWRGRPYYADFVWVWGTVRIVIEVKGYGPHVEQMERKKYCEELNRETFMHGAGLLVISVPHDDVERRPEVIESLLRMVLSRYRSEDAPVSRIQLAEREIVLLAHTLGGAVRPIDVAHFRSDEAVEGGLPRKIDVVFVNRPLGAALQALCPRA